MKAIDPALSAALGAAPGLTGAARADDAGNVLDLAGSLDGESLCAVAAMCKVPLERAAELMGLGAAKDWSFTYAQGALYVHHGPQGMAVVLGTPTKSPETNMKRIAAALGDK